MILDNFFKNLIYEPVSVLGLLVFYFLLINFPISLGAVFKKKSSFTVKLLTIFVNLLISLQLLFRWSISGHFPISNLYESLYFLTWGITMGQLLLEREYQSSIIPSVAIPIELLTGKCPEIVHLQSNCSVINKFTRMVSSLTVRDDFFLKTAPKDIGKLTNKM